MLLFNSWTRDFILLSFIFWITLYFYFSRKYNYWKDRSVPFIKPTPFFGSALDILIRRKSIGQGLRDIYESTKQAYIGLFICDEPCLLVRDPELAKTILIKDFHIWDNRTMTNNKRDDPMGSHILFLIKTQDGWNDVRKKTTPVFSSGSLKLTYNLIKVVGEEMLSYMNQEIQSNNIVDIREVTNKYTTDAITSTSFGINANCFKDNNAEFLQVSRRVFNWGVLERSISTTCHFIAPALVNLFRMRFVDATSADFLRSVFWATMKERERSKSKRNDLIDVLIEMKNTQKIDDSFRFEGDKLVAQATQFFMAGHETTSATLSFTFYELAVNPELQKTLREEIVRVKAQHGGFTYGALQDMSYMDMCLKEVMRKYPSLPFLDRRCNKDYQLPGTDVVLTKGTAVFISNWAMQMDPEYFPEPEKFDPLRFTDENVQSRPAYTYMPFGNGPRNCMGARFGILSAKCAIVHLVENFQIELCKETGHPIKLDPKGFLLAPILHLWLRFKSIKNTDGHLN